MKLDIIHISLLGLLFLSIIFLGYSLIQKADDKLDLDKETINFKITGLSLHVLLGYEFIDWINRRDTLIDQDSICMEACIKRCSSLDYSYSTSFPIERVGPNSVNSNSIRDNTPKCSCDCIK